MKICQSWLSTRKTKSLFLHRCPALPCSFVKSFLGLSLPVDFSYLRICRRIGDRAICLLFLSPCQKVEEPLENYYWRKKENIRMRYIQSYLSFDFIIQGEWPVHRICRWQTQNLHGKHSFFQRTQESFSSINRKILQNTNAKNISFYIVKRQ